jgi:hypothetical protein
VGIPEETFIVRVRPEEFDAVLEQPRLSRRRRVRDVVEVGALIVRWLEPVDSGGHGRTHEEVRDEIRHPT